MGRRRMDESAGAITKLRRSMPNEMLVQCKAQVIEADRHRHETDGNDPLFEVVGSRDVHGYGCKHECADENCDHRTPNSIYWP